MIRNSEALKKQQIFAKFHHHIISNLKKNATDTKVLALIPKIIVQTRFLG